MTDTRVQVAHMGLRQDWLDQVVEDIIDPDRDIVDPHHHFWVREGAVYELAALWADTGAGHNVTQTVFVECFSEYDVSAPEHLQAIGETRYVADLARLAAAQPEKAQVAAIIGGADLASPLLDATLDAHLDAAAGLFRGIRQAGACDPDPEGFMIPGRGRPGLYKDPAFRKGLSRLGARGLTYDTWHYHHQNQDFYDLALAVPETTLVLDHCGTPLGVGRFKGQRDEIFKTWKDDMAQLSQCPNVVAKLGGQAMPDNGWGWHVRDKPATSDEFVAAYGPWYRHMIACFGASRCMFESNFPVDRVSISYPVLWNAFKKIAADYSEADQALLFSGTARQVYHL